MTRGGGGGLMVMGQAINICPEHPQAGRTVFLSVRNETWCPKPFGSPHATLPRSVQVRCRCFCVQARAVRDASGPSFSGTFDAFVHEQGVWGAAGATDVAEDCVAESTSAEAFFSRLKASHDSPSASSVYMYEDCFG